MWRKSVVSTVAALGGMLAFSSFTRAAPVTIEYALSSGVYSYTVTNDMTVPLGDFVIYFPTVSDLTGDVLNYSLSSSSEPAGWSALLTQPSAINLGGMAEWYGGSIAVGGAQGGFSVHFSYTGVNTPGSQYFEVYDPDFNVIDSGFTQLHQPGVPDSGSTLIGLLIGLAGLVTARTSLRRLFVRL